MVVVVVGEYVCMYVWTLFMCTTLCRCLQREKRVSDPPLPPPSELELQAVVS